MILIFDADVVKLVLDRENISVLLWKGTRNLSSNPKTNKETLLIGEVLLRNHHDQY